MIVNGETGEQGPLPDEPIIICNCRKTDFLTRQKIRHKSESLNL